MKGMFSQGVAVLFSAPVELEALRPYLRDFPILKETPAGEHWELGGRSAVIAFRREVNGLALIDTAPQPWPDHMGSPQEEPMLFSAWSMGNFGPFAYPQGLARAMQHAWGWPEARDIAPRHKAFVRVRLSYILGASPDARVLPPAYEPRAELEFLTRVARALLSHPDALCAFNSSGEVLSSAQMIDDSVRYHAGHAIPPLNLWTNVRFFNLSPEWSLMDTVGNWQLDIPDQEAAFPRSRFNPPEVDAFLRNTSLYVLINGDVIKNNDTIDGPGGVRWQGLQFEESVTAPPRATICWVPIDARPPPDQITKRKVRAEAKPPSAPAPERTKWWRRWKR